MEAKVYNQKGEATGEINLPEAVFGLPWNVSTERLVHQVVVAMTGNARNPIAHTKTRGEVSGTGKKPWKQKGTGRARHGSRRSPIWVGGGIAHGPRNDRSFDRKINKKMRAKALFAVLSHKLKDGEVMFVDEFNLKAPKTRDAKSILTSLSKVKGFEGLTRRNNACFVALDGKSDNAIKSFQNFGNLELGQTKDLNPVDLLKFKHLILVNPERSIGALSARAK